jgi:hypothetical protein
MLKADRDRAAREQTASDQTAADNRAVGALRIALDQSLATPRRKKKK